MPLPTQSLFSIAENPNLSLASYKATFREQTYQMVLHRPIETTSLNSVASTVELARVIGKLKFTWTVTAFTRYGFMRW